MPEYGHAHRRLRAAWKPKVDTGAVECARCGQVVEPGARWELDHSDDGGGYNGPAHWFCNRSAGGVRGNAIMRAKAATTIREW